MTDSLLSLRLSISFFDRALSWTQPSALPRSLSLSSPTPQAFAMCPHGARPGGAFAPQSTRTFLIRACVCVLPLCDMSSCIVAITSNDMSGRCRSASPSYFSHMQASCPPVATFAVLVQALRTGQECTLGPRLLTLDSLPQRLQRSHLLPGPAHRHFIHALQ